MPTSKSSPAADGPGECLDHVRAKQEPLNPAASEINEESLISFSQSEYVTQGYGWDTDGLVYVPKNCT